MTKIEKGIHMDLSGLTVIIGLGKTGLSCARFLARQGADFAVTDSREVPPGLAELQTEIPHCRIELGQFSPTLLTQADRLIISPGVSSREPALAQAIERGIPIFGDIEIFAHYAKAPIIAITGSNGKSTVTTLVGQMAERAGLRVCVGGNLGIPALELLSDEAQLYVLELSSFELESTHSLRAKAATVLNISADHMDRYASVSDYASAKHRIYHDCEWAILNRDDEQSYPALSIHADKTVYFTLQPPMDNEWGLVEDDDFYLALGQQRLMKTSEMRIKGRHNVANALAALALGHTIDLPLSSMIETLKSFEGLPHRCQWVTESKGVVWYNDSKGTNVGATEAAISGLGPDLNGKIILLAGGLGKEADFTELRASIEKYARAVILFGTDGPKIATALEGIVPLIHVHDLEEAVSQAQGQALFGDAVLLSPACASYDMFDNFEHRGEVFMQCVLKKM